MCGIFGIYSKLSTKKEKNEISKYIEFLSKLSKKRGQDTFGLLFSNQNKERIFKLNLDPLKAFKRKDYKQYIENIKQEINSNKSFSIIGQTRLVTNGTKFLARNNQPIITEEIIGIHNGILIDENKILDTKIYNKESFNNKSDSLILFENFNKIFISDRENFYSNFINHLKKLEGNYSIAFRIPSLKLNCLSSNCGSLYYLKTKNNLFFASEKNILSKFITRFKLYNSNENHIIKVMNKLIFFNDELEFFSYENWPKKNIINLNSKFKIFDNLTEDTYRKNNLQKCTKCILPITYPFIEFDDDGISNYYRNYKKQILLGEEKLEEILEKFRSKDGKPDCVVGISGGRDSCYGLHLLKTKFKMNPIAFTYDWGLTTDISRINQSKLCGKLGVEHIIRSADIAKKRSYVRNNIMAWLKKPHLGMLPIVQAGDKPFMDYGEIIAKENNIKLVVQFTGYQLEQREFFLGFAGINQPLKNNQRMSSYNLLNKLKMFYFYSTQSIINPAYLNSALLDNFRGYLSSFIKKENSLHFYNYVKWDEKEIIETLKKEYNWSSDFAYGKNQWRMGDGQTTFNNFIYYTIAGFSEYDNFRSNQICEDLIDRQTAVKLAEKDNEFKYEVLKNFSEIIGFNLDDVLCKISSIPKIY